MDNSRPSMPMLGRRASSGAFPVADDFFPAVSFSPEQHAFLKEQAHKLSAEATQRAKWAMSYEDGTNGWKLSNSQRHFRETGIRTYCRRRDARDRDGQRQLEFRCMGKTHMSLERCLGALYSDNTADFRSNSTFFIENALDAVVLSALETRTDDQPHHYLGVNWLASRSPGLFVKSQDLCYLRSLGTTLDSDKNPVGYLVIQSVDLKECASLEHSLGLVRARMSAVLLFKENADARSTSVLWQGSMGLSGHSSSKVVNFVHESFTSIVSNLNKVQEAKYMAQQVEVNKFQRMIAGERKHCYICNKKFSLVRTRAQCSACGENICKDCEVSSRAKAFNNGSFDIPTPTSSRPEVVVFCKKCVTAARRDLNNQEGEVARANPSVRLFDNDTYPASADEGGFRPSNAGKASNQSSSTSTSSLQKLTAERSSILSDRAPLYVGTTIPMSSAGEVPMSPLSVRTEREKRRSRLETDPMESYDGFDNHAYGAQSEDQFEEGIRESCSSYSSYKYGSDRRGSQEARDNDMASRLREISQRAQEALEVTKRNSCMMSDTSSAPRMSDLAAFKELDKSIAEQADLLNVIGLVSTGRVYLENNGPEQGGVRVSESSSIMSEDERFEVIT
ncbi:Zinc finger, RING/FYVE/PHD-type [Phytophthora cinnamomi]|uniref:Zinc finger, RING/FYVE/PHD-type n=1 Tax=Phytophthora cinnamomi TaxID=4785 RepID=UPI003559B515|nr:Zinc finger, RING/FYVE/PHD-type [Phytophthora cinnamomi]